GIGLRVRDPDGSDEQTPRGSGDDVPPDEPILVVPLFFAREGDRGVRRRRRGARTGSGREDAVGKRRRLMDLTSRLQKLEDMIRDAKSMPLSSSALLNREEVLELVVEMRETLPEEIKQARWVVRDREDLLAT